MIVRWRYSSHSGLADPQHRPGRLTDSPMVGLGMNGVILGIESGLVMIPVVAISTCPIHMKTSSYRSAHAASCGNLSDTWHSQIKGTSKGRGGEGVRNGSKMGETESFQ